MKVGICAGLILGGFMLMVGKAGACDLGAPLADAVPGMLLGIGMMAGGVYGLRMEDRRREGKKDASRTGSFASLRMTRADGECSSTDGILRRVAPHTSRSERFEANRPQGGSWAEMNDRERRMCR